MVTKAYSYIRFSTPEQAKGHSLSRQLKLSEKYAAEHNLELDTSLNLKDLGVSAYNGDNLEKGALGVFLRAVNDGIVKEGSYLLVESVDRLSRQTVRKALTLFLSILDKKITIVTLADDKKYDPDSTDELDILVSLLNMARAYKESELKGDRVKAAWDNKKANIDVKKLTKNCPRWLYLSDDKTEYIVDREREKIVKDIYQWCLDGYGTNLIIQRLEKLGIKPWESAKGVKTGRAPKKWHVSYISRLLHNRAVFGEYTLKLTKEVGGEKIISDYYPKIINEDIFYRVQEARKSRDINKDGHGVGRKGKRFSNIFSGIAICGNSIDNNIGVYRCNGSDEKMLFNNKGRGLTYLQCSKRKGGSSGCKSCRKLWRYDSFEKSFLTHIIDIDASVLTGAIDADKLALDSKTKLLTALNGKLADIKEKIEAGKKTFLENPKVPKSFVDASNELASLEVETAKEINRTKSSLQVLTYKYDHSDRAKGTLLSLMGQMSELLESDMLDELYDIRLKLSELLKSILISIEIYSCGVILDDQYFEKIRSQYGEESAKNLKEAEKQEIAKGKLPFYVVNYRSGERRLVVPNPEDSKELFATLKWDGQQFLDRSEGWEAIDPDELVKRLKNQ